MMLLLNFHMMRRRKNIVRAGVGKYEVGLWLPPGSAYDLPDPKEIELDLNSDDNEIVFNLEKISSKLEGAFVDGSSPLENFDKVDIQVYAMRLDGNGWRFTEVDSAGAYSLDLPDGTWLVDYQIEPKGDFDMAGFDYPLSSPIPQKIEIKGVSEELPFDFSKYEKKSAYMSGSIEYDGNIDLNGTTVWAYREANSKFTEFWNEVEVDENGSFSIDVLPKGKYEVGIFIPNALREQGFMDTAIQSVRLRDDENAPGLAFELIKKSEDSFISGRVFDNENKTLVDAYIYATTYDGHFAEAISDDSGNFKLDVVPGYIWLLGGDYIDFDDNNSFYRTEEDLIVDLRDKESESGLSVTMTLPEFVLPDSVSETFDPRYNFVTTLPDGTEITILARSITNKSHGIKDGDEVRLVVTPTARISQDASTETSDYAYSVELVHASTGKKLEGTFEKDVIMSIDVDIEAIKRNGLDIDNLEGKYYSSTKNSWVSAKTSTWDEESQNLPSPLITSVNTV